MQILAETEYQDLYRVTDGVLFVVNKFVRTDYPYSIHYNMKLSRYNKGCQDCLKVLKEDYYDKYRDVTIQKGTVLYNKYPVVKTDDESLWNYQIKTTGDLFSGSAKNMEYMLRDILYRIKHGECVKED